MATPANHGRPLAVAHELKDLSTGRKCIRVKRNGQKCGNWAIRGSTVCHKHGGAAEQVKRTARQRLLEAADPAAAALVELLASGDERIRMQAATALLDRAGHGPGVRIGDERSEAQVDQEIEAILSERGRQVG